jgi:hypothetical protein
VIITQLLIFGLILLLIAGMLAPFESLGWWAGWFGTPAEQIQPTPNVGTRTDFDSHDADHYLVYLSGIGAISGNFLEKEEIAFLDKIAARVPNTVVVRDVFPYAMNNNGLTGQRMFSTIWQWIVKLKLQNKQLLTIFVNLRNTFQVAVCADLRYGPVYNYGTAEVILKGLLRHGYHMSSKKPITILGYSGGAQIALGAATYLQPRLQAPLRIISFGGVMADDPGLYHIEHLYHFHGSKDIVQPLGAIAYAGRWPILPYSPWNRAKAQGKITMIPAGPVRHNDPEGYFRAQEDAPLEQPTPQDHIVDTVIKLIKQAETKEMP